MNNLVSLATLLGLSSASVAATFTVNTTSDVGSENCNGQACSLRGAILAANTTPELDTIAFNIPQSDPGFQIPTQHWRISVGNNDLPVIQAPVVIDGYTQLGATPNTLTPAQGGLNSVLKIEIHGTSGLGFIGLNLLGYSSAVGSTFRGLVIQEFRFSQILLDGNAAHRVEGCYIGTDVRGQSVAFSNIGINIRNGSPQIGGLQPAQRNLLGSQLGSSITGSAEEFNGIVIQGNLIGLNRQGTAALLNQQNTTPAIWFVNPVRNSLIGGSEPNARNIISGNPRGALEFRNSAENSGTRIEGNYIGTDFTGIHPIGNGYNIGTPRPSISLYNAPINAVNCNFTVGGVAQGQANLIAFGAGAGIAVSGCKAQRMPFNRFLGNAGAPVDLGEDGATPNDINDADEGGNRLQNFPEITLPAAGSSTLSYRVDSTTLKAAYPITVYFYRAGCGGGSDALLTSTTISAAQAQQTLLLDTSSLGLLFPLTAAAVDADGNTSEFTPVLGEQLMRSGFEDSLAPLVPGTCQ